MIKVAVSEHDDEEMVKTLTKGLPFVHQTRDQRWLLEHYRNEITMLDHQVQPPSFLCRCEDQHRLPNRGFFHSSE